MNLIPSNSCFKPLEGSTADLPSITQYLSLVLDADESLKFYQSDMSAAFYLFKLPLTWSSKMCFNIAFPGELLGLQTGVLFRPACAVISYGMVLSGVPDAGVSGAAHYAGPASFLPSG